MNSYQDQQISFNENNQVSINKSEKFQEAVNDMRLMMWKKYLSGVRNNPNMTKKEICTHLGLKVGTINSIQQHYKLQSPFYYKKPKAHKKKKESITAPESAPKSKSKNTELCSAGRACKKTQKENTQKFIAKGNYDFDETFNDTAKSLSISSSSNTS